MSRIAVEALSIAVAARTPVLLWGGPGTGKTSAVLALARSAGLPHEVVIASIREPSDFAGLPVVSDGGDAVRMAPPAWARRLADEGRGLLFLDELSTAPPAVQAALLRVVLERTVGDLTLPDDVVILAAANPPDEAANGWNLAAPLANRFCHLDWSMDAAEWADGVVGGFPTAHIPSPPPDLASHLLRSRAEIAGFLRRRPALLHRVPDNDAEASRSWPSPRSWTMAGHVLGWTSAVSSSDEVAATLVAGAVGPAAAAELFAWRSDGALPDPEDILRDPSSLQLPARADRAFAVLGAVVAAVVADCTPERWLAAWTAIAKSTEGESPDIAIPAVRSLVQHRPAGATPPADVLLAMAPLLRAAGMLDAFRPTDS